MIWIYQDIKSKQKQSPRVIFFFFILLPKICPHSKQDWATAINRGQRSKWTSAGIEKTPEKLWAVSGHKKIACRRAVITENAAFPLPGSLQTARVPNSRESTQAMPEATHEGSPCAGQVFHEVVREDTCAREHSCGCTIQPGTASKDPQQAKLASTGSKGATLENCTQIKEESVNGLHLKIGSSQKCT